MTARFLLRCVGLETEVYDATTGETVYGPASFDSAKADVADRNMRKPEAPSAAVPCCDHADTIQRYQHALAQIGRFSECEYARRMADDALAGGQCGD